MLIGQESEKQEEELSRWRASAYIGQTLIPVGEQLTTTSDNLIAPTFGIDFTYKMSPRWFITSMNDVELASYLINTGDIVNLNREYAFITALVVTWEVLPHWGIFAGPGIELEKHENFYVTKIGTEYIFVFSNKWDLGVAVGLDRKFGVEGGVFTTYSMGLGVGKVF